MGMNSGEVIVGKIGDDLRMDYTAQGQTVNLAARMEQIAAPGHIYLTDRTAQQVEGYCRFRDVGPLRIMGVRDDVRVWDLEDVGTLRTRLDAARSRGFSKFVGRERELAALEDAFDQAAAGRGQVVGVVASAGTGKSRLCAEFVARCRARGIQVADAQCPTIGKSAPFLPLLELLRDLFGIAEADSADEARRKIAGALSLSGRDFDEVIPLVFDLLGVRDPDHAVPTMDPEARKRKLLAFVRHLVQARSAGEPLLIFIDDAHWIDSGSDEFLAQVVEAAGGTRTLVLVNFRPPGGVDRQVLLSTAPTRTARPRGYPGAPRRPHWTRSLGGVSPRPDLGAHRRESVLHRGSRAIARRKRDPRRRSK
jgi:AAA ATPase domain/Adenylate and Guanylate cyclase catalytic domain